MAELKLRYNPEAEEAELVVDNEVALSSGKEVFASWVEAYNDAHPPVEPEPTEEEKALADSQAKLDEAQKEIDDLKNQLEVANAANEEHELSSQEKTDNEQVDEPATA